MAQLMAGDRAKGSVRHVCGNFHVEDRKLHEAGREDDLVAWRVVVCVDGRHRHPPLVPVDRLAQSIPPAPVRERTGGDSVTEKVIAIRCDVCVIRPELLGVGDVGAFSRVANFLHDVMDLGDSSVGRDIIHPLCGFELFDELVLDIFNDRVAKILGLCREGLLDEKAAKEPAESLVHMANATSPSERGRFRILANVSHRAGR